MTATTHPSGRRAAATWVGATGSFLVLAAAAVFVAVRWNQIPDVAKLALVLGLTAGCLAAGRALRSGLPATGDVLFHLGAFLLPVDVAGVCLHFDLGWRGALLAEGAVCLAAYAVLARSSSSVTLARAATMAMLVLAAGAAGVTPVPATLVLALVAVAARAAGVRRAAAAWAAVAGLAPALGAAAGVVLRGLEGTRLHVGAGTLAELGLTVPDQQLAAVVSGLLAAAVLAREAGVRRDLRLAFLALASACVGAGTSAVAARIEGDTVAIGLAAMFAAVEVVALLVFDDDFWGWPLARTAEVAEVVAAAATVVGGVAVVLAPLSDAFGAGRGSVAAGAALALLALGWLAADARRAERGSPLLRPPLVQGTGWVPATAGAAVALTGAVAMATSSSLATAVALVVVATGLLACGRAGAAGVAAGFLPWAVVTASAHGAVVSAIGIAGGVALAVAARRVDGPAAVALAAEATTIAVVSSLWLAFPFDWWQASCLAAVAAWVVASVLDLSRPRLGDLARIGMLAPVTLASALPPGEAIAPLTLAVALYVLDAARLGRPAVAAGGAVAVQPLVVALARASEVPLPWAGFALCVCAVAWSGLAAVVNRAWRFPLVVAAAASLLVGTRLAMGDAEALSHSLSVAGLLGVTAGIVVRDPAMGHTGAAVLTAGIFGHLLLAGVAATEAYVAPVAAQLLVAGWQLRRVRRLSSWAAYVPSVALLGGTALLERSAGGGGWHAVAAGATGVAAVGVGGWRRLAGPLVAGTGLVGLVGARESLSALAGVPTWAWLGLGGAVLLLIAVLLERSDTSPAEAGRRVVEVLADRFD